MFSTALKNNCGCRCIDHFYVKLGCTRRGIGRQMFKAVSQELTNRGITAAYLSVSEGNKGGLEFYKAMGGEIGKTISGDLFGTPIAANVVRWPSIAAVSI